MDLLITDNQDIIDDIEIKGPLGKSDHAVLKITCKLDCCITDNIIGKLNYGKGDYEGLRKSLDKDWVQMFDGCYEDVNKIAECLRNVILSNSEKYIPSVSKFHK